MTVQTSAHASALATFRTHALAVTNAVHRARARNRTQHIYLTPRRAFVIVDYGRALPSYVTTYTAIDPYGDAVVKRHNAARCNRGAHIIAVHLAAHPPVSIAIE